MMDTQLLINSINDFLRRHNCDMTISGREDKLLDEVAEFECELIIGDALSQLDEMADVLITLLALYSAHGINDPIFHAYDKLTRSAASVRYCRGGK